MWCVAVENGKWISQSPASSLSQRLRNRTPRAASCPRITSRCWAGPMSSMATIPTGMSVHHGSRPSRSWKNHRPQPGHGEHVQVGAGERQPVPPVVRARGRVVPIRLAFSRPGRAGRLLRLPAGGTRPIPPSHGRRRCTGCSSATCSCSSTGPSRCGRCWATCTSNASTSRGHARLGRLPGEKVGPERPAPRVLRVRTAVLFCWAMSPWADDGQVVVENWFKILVFYVLLVSSAQDEKGCAGWPPGSCSSWRVHAALLRELRRRPVHVPHGHRPDDRRGQSLGRPEQLWGEHRVRPVRSPGPSGCRQQTRWARPALAGYLMLSVGCILLTGSRSSLGRVSVWGAFVILRSRHRWLGISAAAIGGPPFFPCPARSLQTRFETIVNPDVGPENARVSGEGRLEGLTKGAGAIEAYPATGIGPGSWRPATEQSRISRRFSRPIRSSVGTSSGHVRTPCARPWVSDSARKPPLRPDAPEASRPDRLRHRGPARAASPRSQPTAR